MNKLFTKIAKVLLGLSMAVGVGSSFLLFKNSANEVKAEPNGTYVLEIVYGDFTTKSYADNDGSHSKNATKTAGTGDATYSVSFTTSNIYQNSSKMQWKKSSGLLYNTTDLGSISSVVITSGSGLSTVIGSSENPSSAVSGGGYFKVAAEGSTAYSTKITITFTIGSGSTPTESFGVTYNANGADFGVVPTDDVSYPNGDTVTVKGNPYSLARNGYTFSGWNTKSDGTGTNYAAGVGTFEISGNTTLYAKWVSSNKYTYQHIFTAAPSTGSNISLSSINWDISATSLGSYNSTNYAGVQFGTKSANGSIQLTSSSAWGAQSSTTYYDKTKITEIRLWLNLGGTSVTPAVTIGGVSAISDGTTVIKNSSAGSNYYKATKVSFTPASSKDSGVVVISVSSVNAGYICAIEIECEQDNTPRYTVRWNNYDEETLEIDENVKSGTTPSYDGSAPTKPSTNQYVYSFTGWKDQNNVTFSDLYTVSGDTTFTAQFSQATREYTITWKDGNNSTIYSEQLAYGATPSYNSQDHGVPAKNSTAQYSYTFNNTWSPAITTVSGDATYTAQFNQTLRQYTVTWNDGDGNEIYSETLNYGATPSYSSEIVPTKASTAQYTYTFNNTWSPSIASVTGDVTYTAQFNATIVKYTVTYNDGNGNTHVVENVPYGSYTLLSFGDTGFTAPTGYRFKAWSIGGSEVSISSVNITGNTTITAVYIHEWTLSFESNGGSGTMSSIIYVDNQVVQAPNCAFIAPSGKAFDTWNDGTTDVAPGSDITMTSNITLTANWINVWNVTYTDGSNNYVVEDVKQTNAYELIDFEDATTLEVPIGYAFKCWSVEIEGVDTEVDPGDTIALSGGITITAVFEEKAMYGLINDVSKLSIDYKYVIVYESGSKVMGSQNAGSYRNVEDCTLSNHTLEPSDDYAQLELEDAGDGYWYLKDTTASSGYLYISNDTSNQLLTTASKTTGDSADQCKWEISFDGDNAVIQNVAFKTSGRRIMFNNRFATYKGTQNEVQLYREVKKVPGIEVNQTNVVVGTKSTESVIASYVDGATGTINWTITSGSDKITIANSTGLTNTITGVATGAATITVSCSTYRSIVINVTVITGSAYVSSKITSFTKVTSAPSDWTGLYILAATATGSTTDYYASGHTYAVDGAKKPFSTGNLNYTEVTVSGSSIEATADTINLAFLITKSDKDGLYYVKSYFSGYYIGNLTNVNSIVASRADQMYNSIAVGGLTGYNAAGTASTGTTLKMAPGGDKTKMVYTSGSGAYTVSLYKADGNIYEISDGGTLDTFYSDVKSQSALVCESTSKNWSKLQTLYSPLSADDKNVLKTTIAKASEAGGNYIEDFLSDYDYCVNILHFEDIFGRYGTGGANAGQREIYNNLSLVGMQNANLVAIIVIISMVSVTAIGGYFFLRTRKEN